jgi:2'-5' RNA ligase
MARIRTFIAVDLGKAIRDRVVAMQDALARTGTEVKWVEPENLHVSLLFLGEVDDREIPAVCRVVAECCQAQAPFSMSVETVGCFPNPRRPRVLWVGIGEGTQDLCALHDALEPPLMDLGCYRREERKYTPHVTLGRVKSDRPTETLTSALTKNAGWKGGEVTVSEVLVLSSKLSPQGPEYAVLSRAKLGGG